jgi:hypothetical protein
MLEGLMLIFFAAVVYLERIYAPGKHRPITEETATTSVLSPQSSVLGDPS